MSAVDAHRKFVARTHRVARQQGKTVVAWDEVFDLFGGKEFVGQSDGLHPDTVIQQWRWSWDHLARTKAITDAGLRMLWMVDTSWYLDQLHETWENMWEVMCVCVSMCVCVCIMIVDGRHFVVPRPVCVCARACVHRHTHTHAYLPHVSTSRGTCIYRSTCAIYTHTYVYTYIHIHTNIHTYMHTYI